MRPDASAAPSAAQVVELYGASHALVIGIDDYRGGWPRLRNAVEDAEAVAAALRARGFEVVLKTNLDSQALQSTLKQFFAVKGSDPEARLLLWFAGHGHTLNGEGFIVPADAPTASDPQFKVKALHLRDFGGLMRLVDAKHVLSVFDACFAGTIFDARAGAPPAAITRKTGAPVRQFVTSGDAGQQVRDDGSFRELFLRAIRGEERADANQDGYLTGEELGLYLSQRMSSLTAAAQTPRYGKLQDLRFDRGDFVFLLPDRPAPAAAGEAGDTAEIVFWRSVRESSGPGDYEAYLTQFPEGNFAALAKARLRQLGAGTPPEPSFEVDPLEGIFVVLKTANVRARPSAEDRKLGLLPRLSTVAVTGNVKDASWLRIAYNGRNAFVFEPLLRLVPSNELAAWQRARASGDAAELRDFARSYPNSAFAPVARSAAAPPANAQAPKTQAPVESTTDREERLWLAIADSSHAQDFDYFLQRYPAGRFAASAKQRLAALAAEPAPATSSAEATAAAIRAVLNGRWAGELRITDLRHVPPAGTLGYIDGTCEIQVKLRGGRFREYLDCFNRAWILSGSVGPDGSLYATSLYETHGGLFERVYPLTGSIRRAWGSTNVRSVGNVGEARLALTEQ